MIKPNQYTNTIKEAKQHLVTMGATLLTPNEFANSIQAWREAKGFFTPSSIDTSICPVPLTNADAMLGKLLLVHSEVSEAGEAVRQGDMDNFKEEIIDAIIRLFDIAATTEIDIEAELIHKMALNAARPIRHGKKTTL